MRAQSLLLALGCEGAMAKTILFSVLGLAASAASSVVVAHAAAAETKAEDVPLLDSGEDHGDLSWSW
jgi:hypothetical protein